MIVVDCAALVDALGAAPDTDALRQRLSGQELHAPTLIDYEFVSALRGMMLRRAVDDPLANDMLHDFEDLPIRRWPSTDGMRRRALGLRDCVSAYDASYVALAEVLECPLVTRDKRLARAAGHGAQIEAF